MKDSIVIPLNARFKNMEKQYDISVLWWFFRGSIGIDIYRENSDLDIGFIFLPQDKNCHAIHDIIGYGLDLWGESIFDAIEDIKLNSESFYINKNEYIPLFLSSEHKRGGLSYFNFYSIIGKQYSYVFLDNNEELMSMLKNTYEKGILISFLIDNVKGTVKKIHGSNTISANEYLYAVWYILMAYNLSNDGLPGQENIRYLLEKYAHKDLDDKVLELRNQYKKTYSKTSLMLRDSFLDEFITEHMLQIKHSDYLTSQSCLCFDASKMDIIIDTICKNNSFSYNLSTSKYDIK